MPPTAEGDGRFELEVPALAGHVPTVRLFCTTVGRALAADSEVLEDLKLAVSEVVTAIVLAGKHERVRVDAIADDHRLLVALGPIEADDLVDGAIDPIDIVCAVFPDAWRDPATLTLTIPVPLGDGS